MYVNLRPNVTYLNCRPFRPQLILPRERPTAYWEPTIARQRHDKRQPSALADPKLLARYSAIWERARSRPAPLNPTNDPMLTVADCRGCYEVMANPLSRGLGQPE